MRRALAVAALAAAALLAPVSRASAAPPPLLTGYLAHGPIQSMWNNECIEANDHLTAVHLHKCIAKDALQTWTATIIKGSLVISLASDPDYCIGGLPWYADYAGMYFCGYGTPPRIAVRQGLLAYGRPGGPVSVRSLRTREWLTAGNARDLVWQRGPTFIQRLLNRYPADQRWTWPFGWTQVTVEARFLPAGRTMPVRAASPPGSYLTRICGGNTAVGGYCLVTRFALDGVAVYVQENYKTVTQREGLWRVIPVFNVTQMTMADSVPSHWITDHENWPVVQFQSIVDPRLCLGLRGGVNVILTQCGNPRNDTGGTPFVYIWVWNPARGPGPIFSLIESRKKNDGRLPRNPWMLTASQREFGGVWVYPGVRLGNTGTWYRR